MDAHEGEQSCSRRGFLVGGARITTGAALGPVLVHLAGCGGGGGEAVAPKAEPEGLVLRPIAFSDSPDGRRRQIWAYNRALPGPMIRAKEGETLRVRLVN